ncbi:MAG: NAD-dependent malic enzyme [Candidatus Omnitrophica bacterium]|nr:NAD-dependent malic enzyme [Candidatus Omnitrophota bacterium]
MSTPQNASYTITLRVHIPNSPGMLGKLATCIGDRGGSIGAIDLVDAGPDHLVRDMTVDVQDERHAERIARAVREIEGVDLISVSDKVFLLHLGGKLSITPKEQIQTRETLSRAYIPGVNRVASSIHDHPRTVFNLTIKSNTIALVTDGSSVLDLGDIGPEAALPVMEGKAMLFKELGGVDAFPICLGTRDAESFVQAVKAIAPTFGGVCLEAVSAPRCHEIEERLIEELDIPVFDDNQHGTAVVVLAALLNAAKVVHKELEDMKIAVAGTGAGGLACVKLLLAAGVREIVTCDSAGIVFDGRLENTTPSKLWLAEHTNHEGLRGGILEAAEGADAFIGVSAPRALPVEALKRMEADPIVFALADPMPEIDPLEASRFARIVATGRSDLPNQISDLLCVPGLFRGALDIRAARINDAMKLAAAHAIAGVIQIGQLCEEYILPSVFNREVPSRVADAVAWAAIDTEVARRRRPMRDRQRDEVPMYSI